MQQYILQIAVLLFSVIVHEVAHGYVAYKRGDDTAKMLGRLTLNPLPHLDIFGSIIFPAILVFCGLPAFGWAKPVPVNICKLKNIKQDVLLVSIAGVGANFLLALIASFLMFCLRTFLPLSPTVAALHVILSYIVIINIVLFVFNIIPIPPLDGSRVLLNLLPSQLAQKYAKLEPYGFIIVMILLLTGWLWKLIAPLIANIINFLIGGF